MQVIIWHNSRCRKSREGLQYLRDKGIEPTIFEYMHQKIDPQELARIIKLSGQPLEVFIRKNEPEYKQLGLNSKNLTIEEFARIAAEHPRLLQRPIVICGEKAVLARPASKIEEIL